MKEITISKNEDGIRLSKYLKKIFKTIPDSLLYKLFRKKYFVLNDKKSDGKEILKNGDVLKIFLSDATYNKYSNNINTRNEESIAKVSIDRIVYEDNNIILYDKPVGMLSQDDKTGDTSVNSILKGYVKKEKNSIFTPSVVNRLDRNTSGIIIFAKNYISAREISKMIKEQKLEKRYMATVNGVVKHDEEMLTNYFKKDEKNNKAIISDKKITKDYVEVKLIYKVLKRNIDTSILDINLITGKSHQIRAQLSHINHPLICDKKYMSHDLYKENVKKYGNKSQDLICYKITFAEFDNEQMKYLSGKVFKIER